MKSLRMIGSGLMLMNAVFCYAQKTISEGTISYDILIQTGNKQPQTTDASDRATSTVSLKGSLSRTDMTSALGNETTIHDSKTGSSFILKEYSGQKLMITLTPENWIEKNKKYEGLTFQTNNDTKAIAGYTCKMATAKLSDGSLITVYYATDLNAINKEYDPTFKSLPGLPMQYEFEKGKMKFRYTVSKVDFSSVPSAKFDSPKAGYRVMTYDENKKGKKEF